MKIVPVEQGSVDWLEARCGIPTASEFDTLVTPLWKVKTGEGPNTYLMRKLAEKWAGPIIDFKSFAMEQGNVLEETALPWYQFETGEVIERVGFVTDDKGRVGCSPDGLLGDHGGIEIKCPTRPIHVKYLLSGEVPPEYLPQVQGSMFVTGRPWWKFVSFNRQFPPLIITVESDPKAQDAIAEAVSEFLSKFDGAWQRLCDLNGGAPPPRPTAAERPRFTFEENADITP